MGAAKRLPVPSHWIRTEADRRAVREGHYFDEEAADFVCRFFEKFLYLSVGRWAGKPLKLESWQRDYLSMLFGWKRPNGERRFTESYVEIPKKNGKSGLGAGLGIFGLLAEPGAEVYQGAANRKQAGIIYRECSKMIQASPSLQHRFRVLQSKNTIVYAANNARLKSLSADADSEDGANASLVILDEVHRFKSRNLYDVMKYAGAAREEPLLVSFTTAGSNRYSLCWELHERGRKIIDGTSDELEFLPLIYGVEADIPDDDLDNENLWKSVNPSLGTILSLDSFRSDFHQAKRVPAQWANFKRLRLNIWVPGAARWLDVKLWDEAAVERHRDEFPPLFWESDLDVCVGGDLSSVRDLTALCFAVRRDETIWFKYVFFLPEDTIDARSEADGVPYRYWAESGHVVITKGASADYGAVRQYLLDRRDIDGWKISKLAFDPWNANHILTLLDGDGFEVMTFPQTYRHMGGPSKELERRLLNGTVRHDGNPVARWCVENCSVREDFAGNIMPDKKKSAERIDAVPATVMALALTLGPDDYAAECLIAGRDD